MHIAWSIGDFIRPIRLHHSRGDLGEGDVLNHNANVRVQQMDTGNMTMYSLRGGVLGNVNSVVWRGGAIV